MKASYRNLVRVLGFSLSGIFSILFVFTGNCDVGMSVSLGLLGVITTLLMDLLFATSQARDEALAVLSLSRSIFADKDFSLVLRNIVEAFSQIAAEGGPSIFIDEARRVLAKQATILTSIAQGDLPLDEVRRMEMLIKLVDSAGKGDEIVATSYVSLGDWWNRELGQQYLEANRRAKGRGAEVRRVFILGDSEPVEMREFVELQAREMTEVLVARERSVHPEFKENFFILNQNLLSFAEYSRDGQLIRGYISKDARKLQEYKQKFAGLHLSAMPVEKFFRGDPPRSTSQGAV